jgi:NAD(P)-dependent dehydrogenase (short-subunit alcohol dehydrogenase family)
VGRFASDNVLVIGGTSEIGTAVAERLVLEGSRVTVTGRDQEKLESLQRALGGRARTAICDLTDKVGRGGAVKAAARHDGPFNSMVYVAGYHRLMPMGPAYASSLERHLLINVEAPLDLIRTFLSKGVSDDGRQRSVTVIASIAHRVGEPALSAYSASKGAIVSAVRSLAVELARRNVRINTVSPGWIEGQSADRVAGKMDMTMHEKVRALYPLGFGTPNDVAEAVAYIASSGAKWVTGVDLVIDGGRTCV